MMPRVACLLAFCFLFVSAVSGQHVTVQLWSNSIDCGITTVNNAIQGNRISWQHAQIKLGGDCLCLCSFILGSVSSLTNGILGSVCNNVTINAINEVVYYKVPTPHTHYTTPCARRQKGI